MKNLLLLSVVFFIGCSSSVIKQPATYGFLPDTLKVMNELLKPIASSKDTNKYDDFKSIAIDGGIGKQCLDDACKKYDSLKLPCGMLISDKKAYMLVYNQMMIDDVNKRLVVADELFKNYQKNVFTAQSLYDKRILELEKKNERSWFEQNSIYIGFTIGLLTTIATEYAVIHVSK